MSKFSILFICMQLLLSQMLPLELSAQDDYESHFFSKVYNCEEGDCYSSRTVELGDGYMIVGLMLLDSGLAQMYAMKLSLSGEALWQKPLLTGNLVDWYLSRQGCKASDGNLVISQNERVAPGKYNLHYMKITPEGDILWHKMFFGNEEQSIYKIWQIIETSDESLLLIGKVYSTNLDGDIISSGRSYCAKLDTDGNVLWEQEISRPLFAENPEDDYRLGGISVLEKPSGDYLLASDVCRASPDLQCYQGTRVIVMQTLSAIDGAITHEIVHDKYPRQTYGRIVPFNSAGFLLSTHIEESPFQFEEEGSGLTRYNYDGELIWDKAIPNYSFDRFELAPIIQSNNQIISCFSYRRFSVYDEDYNLSQIVQGFARFDPWGNWVDTTFVHVDTITTPGDFFSMFAYGLHYEIFGLIPTSDGGLLATGWVGYQGDYEMWLLKLGAGLEGCSEAFCDSSATISFPVSQESLVQTSSYSTFPVPASDHFSIAFENGPILGSILLLTDLNGRLHRKFSVSSLRGPQSFSTAGLADGLYLWELQSEGVKPVVGKVIIDR